MGGSLTPPSPGLPPAALEMLTLFMEAVSASGEKPTRFTLGPRMSALLPGVLGEGVGLAGMAALAGSSLGALVLMNLARWGLSQACSHSALAPGRSPGAFFSACHNMQIGVNKCQQPRQKVARSGQAPEGCGTVP